MRALLEKATSMRGNLCALELFHLNGESCTETWLTSGRAKTAVEEQQRLNQTWLLWTMQSPWQPKQRNKHLSPGFQYENLLLSFSSFFNLFSCCFWEANWISIGVKHLDPSCRLFTSDNEHIEKGQKCCRFKENVSLSGTVNCGNRFLTSVSENVKTS